MLVGLSNKTLNRVPVYLCFTLITLKKPLSLKQMQSIFDVARVCEPRTNIRWRSIFTIFSCFVLLCLSDHFDPPTQSEPRKCIKRIFISCFIIKSYRSTSMLKDWCFTVTAISIYPAVSNVFPYVLLIHYLPQHI